MPTPEELAPVRVSAVVLEGLAAVRESAVANMGAVKRITEWLIVNGYWSTADWIAEDPPRYIRGIFVGFEEEDPDPPEVAK